MFSGLSVASARFPSMILKWIFQSFTRMAFRLALIIQSCVQPHCRCIPCPLSVSSHVSQPHRYGAFGTVGAAGVFGAIGAIGAAGGFGVVVTVGAVGALGDCATVEACAAVVSAPVVIDSL